jgi:glycerophosphoryl diester phosphodiesterase
LINSPNSLPINSITGGKPNARRKDTNAANLEWKMSLRRALSTLTLTLLVGCSSASPNTNSATCPPSPFRSKTTLIIAHASGEWFGPPNSIEMMTAARTAGADVLDLDIRTTADGQLVASHDDGIGVDGKSISASSLAELKQIDLRETWDNPGELAIDSPVHIPTVKEALNAFPKTRFSLEFKTTGGEQALCDLLRDTKRTKSVYVSSAGDAAVDTFKPLCSEVVTTVTDAMVPLMQAAQQSGITYCSPVPIGQPPLQQGDFSLDKSSVEWEHQHGLATYTWTADTEEALQFVSTLGVDAVYTARPDLASKILRH